MSRVKVICQNYQKAYLNLNGAYDIEVTSRKYLAATLTLGFQRLSSVLQAGPRLWLHRFGQGLSSWAYLSNNRGELCLSGDHRDLDGSEKGGISYWQGMVFAKLAAAEVLRVRWLQHADAMEKMGGLKRTTGVNMGKGRNKRADMVGQDDHGHWHVVEAKGFSRVLPTNAIQNAKDQAAIVGTINNAPPATTSASVSCLWKTPIEIILDDPSPDQKESWHLENGDFWINYYGNLAKYIHKNRQPYHDLPEFSFAPLHPLLGIDSWLPWIPPWEMPMIGLPTELLKDVSMAPAIMQRLLDSSSNLYDQVLQDGVALVGHVDDFMKAVTE